MYAEISTTFSPNLFWNLARQVSARDIVSKQLHITFATHPHEFFRSPVNGWVSFLSWLAGQLLLPVSIVRLLLFPSGVLFENFDVGGCRGLCVRGFVVDFDAFGDLDVVHGAEQCSLPLNLALGKVELTHSSGQAVGAVAQAYVEGPVFRFAREPGMLKAFVDCDSLIDVDGQHAVDQVQCLVSNVVPVWRRIVKPATFDLIRKSIRILSGAQLVTEWWEAAKTDVQDHSQGPDIHSTGVFSLAVLGKDLRGNICRRC